jgi:1-phosphatidylinositol-4-phosphate 5-kinase
MSTDAYLICVDIVGIIDILQQYTTRKIAETFFKGMTQNKKEISSVNPELYGNRFIEFMEKSVLVDE